MGSSSENEDTTGPVTRFSETGAGVNLSLFTRYPTSLAMLSLFVGVGMVGIAQLPAGSVARFVLAVPLIFFCPGYAVVAVLYPTFRNLPVANVDRAVVRYALSFGLSLAVVPITATVAISFGEPDFRYILASLGVWTLVVTQLAVLRRFRVPQEDRYRFPLRGLIASHSDSFRTRSSFRQFTLVFLLVGLVLSMGAVFVGVATPPSEHNYTELYVGTENETGTVTTTDYPDTLSGDTPLVVSLTNYESTGTEYVVVVQLQDVDQNGDVERREKVNRFRTEIEAGETWHQSHRPTPTLSGDNLRLQYLLYRDEAPAAPTESTAYRTVHIWVNN